MYPHRTMQTACICCFILIAPELIICHFIEDRDGRIIISFCHGFEDHGLQSQQSSVWLVIDWLNPKSAIQIQLISHSGNLFIFTQYQLCIVKSRVIGLAISHLHIFFCHVPSQDSMRPPQNNSSFTFNVIKLILILIASRQWQAIQFRQDNITLNSWGMQEMGRKEKDYTFIGIFAYNTLINKDL